MIISGYAKKHWMSISEAAAQLLAAGGIDYLEECYDTLHMLSNNDVIRELTDIAKQGTPQ